MATGKTLAYYVPSTHWDREWYEPFQHFRYHLVDILDELLDTMASDDRYACFQTDGQSILLEDYLEIRPERAEQVREFAAQGRLRVGPWYTMPDENIVGPESLIRNLEEGLRVAREFGRDSQAGFICDIFGHISQLPQIFQGFGIRSAFLFRGVNEDTHRGLFRWQGADGSELVTFRFGPKEGYFDFAAYVRRGFDVNAPLVEDEAVERLSEYVDLQKERVGLDTVLLFDGGDHMPIEPRMPDLLARLQQARPDVEVRHVGLDEFADAVCARREKISRVFSGELRESGRLADGTWVIPGVLSSRIRQKQDNRARETELCCWAEPFGHLAARLTGCEYPQAYIRRAWRYLLENHAHDSICSCSPDQIHKDMEFRFDQARLINSKVIGHALEAIASRVDQPDLEGDDFAMVLFNPTQAEVDGPVDFELWFDEKTNKLFSEFFRYESKVGFRLYDAEGQELPYDLLGYTPQRRRFYRSKKKVSQGQECIVVKVSAALKIPAFGYTTITCRPVADPTRHPAGRMVIGDRALENEHLCVSVQANGSLTLHDKRSGRTYERLMIFEDRADIGDGWYHGVAVNDRILSSTACPADVAVVEDGALVATLRITNRMQIPEQFEFDRQMRRSEATAPLLIDNYVTLRSGADHVEIRTVVDNQVRDHRLRVLFESGAVTDSYLADSAFDIVQRKIDLPPDNHTYKELAVETTPQATWTAAFDDGRGLAVVAPDLPETTVRDVPQRTLALTLLRGFRRTIFTDGEEGGQSLGRHEFRYRLVPLGGEPSYTRLAQLAQFTAAGIRAQQILPRQQADKTDRTLPPTLGQLSMQPGRVIVTSLRRRYQEERTELRLFNPYAQAVDEVIAFDGPIASANLVDLDGNEQESITVDDAGRIELTIAAKKIVTIAVRFGS